MMNDIPPFPAVAVGDCTVSLSEFLRRLHRRGGLLPLLREAAVEELIRRQAHALSLTVPVEELQRAANDFRRRHGLASAEQMHAWLAEQRLSVPDFEAALEHNLLQGKLKEHLTRDHIAGFFATHQGDYARARLRQIVVAQEDLARELLTQAQEEGRDFGLAVDLNDNVVLSARHRSRGQPAPAPGSTGPQRGRSERSVRFGAPRPLLEAGCSERAWATPSESRRTNPTFRWKPPAAGRPATAGRSPRPTDPENTWIPTGSPAS